MIYAHLFRHVFYYNHIYSCFFEPKIEINLYAIKYHQSLNQ